MFRRCLPAIILLLCAHPVCAQAKLDSYLPAHSQLYLSWDGIDAHRDVFNKSAIGKTLQGDTGKFLAALVKFAEDQLKNYENDIGADAGHVFKEVKRLTGIIRSSGFRSAVAVDGFLPPHIEAMTILPTAAAAKTDLLPLITKLAARSGLEVVDSKIEGRLVHKLDLRFIEIGWWNEQGDLIVSVATNGIKNSVARVAGAGPNLTDYPLYKRVTSVNGFPVWARGYIDLEGVLNQLGLIAPPARQIIDELGLKDLKSVAFQSGFDGPAERSVIEIDVPGPRKGILRLANLRKIKLADLPPVPIDATVISASSLDANQAYDVVFDSIETVAKNIAPKEAQQLKTAVQVAEAILGIALREDLIAPIGDMVMYYSSPTEVPLGLGGVYLVKVKDEDTMNKTLARLINLTGGIPGVDVRVKDSKYHGAIIHTISVNHEGNFQAPSFVIHKGWLAFSYYPQPVQGFVLRMNNEMPGWKASKSLEKTLSNLPTEFTALTISDPRPTLKLILSLAPVGMSAVNGLLANRFPKSQFDVSLIPNSHEATRHLFPNVTIVTDDGSKIRIETRASLMLPF